MTSLEGKEGSNPPYEPRGLSSFTLGLPNSLGKGEASRPFKRTLLNGVVQLDDSKSLPWKDWNVAMLSYVWNLHETMDDEPNLWGLTG